jgi:hypothetical protein
MLLQEQLMGTYGSYMHHAFLRNASCCIFVHFTHQQFLTELLMINDSFLKGCRMEADTPLKICGNGFVGGVAANSRNYSRDIFKADSPIAPFYHRLYQ